LKKIKFIVVVIIICLSQIILGNEVNKKFELKGELINFDKDTIMVHNKQVKVDSQGKFQYTFNFDKPTFIKIKFGKEIDLYAIPGKNIQLHIDVSKNVNAVNISGDLEEINQFLVKEDFYNNVNKYFKDNRKRLMSLNGQEFTQQVDLFFKPYFKNLDEFPTTNETLKLFKKSYQAILQYSRANILIKYPRFYRRLNKNPGFQPQKGFYDFIKELDINDPFLLELDESRYFLWNLIDYNVEKRVGKDKFKTFNLFRAKIYSVIELFQNKKLRDELLHSLMQSLLEWHHYKGGEDLIELFKNNFHNKKYLAEIDTSLSQDIDVQKNAIVKVYKKIGDVSLDVFIYLPKDFKKTDKRAALAFFHGGGWAIGKPQWGAGQCEHFANKGMVAMSFEYRLIEKHGTTPVECVIDAKSAIRWMRQHAKEYGIDVNRIVASGFSAGGHIAACTVTTDKFNEPFEDQSISSKANALILWVTPVNIEHDGWVMPKLSDRTTVLDCSPNHGIKPGLPPVIMFEGTADEMVPYKYTVEFAEKMKALNNRCDLHLYERQTHLDWSKNAKDVFQKMDDFLISINFLIRNTR